MSEILFKGEAEEISGQVDEQAQETGTVALSADDFAALEERILRAVDQLKHERQARSAAEERAAQAEALAREQNARADRLERDIQQLRAERDHIRKRIDKLLKQLDALEM